MLSNFFSLFCFLLVVSSAVPVSAQVKKSYRELGYEEMKKGNWVKAATRLSDWTTTNPRDADAFFLLAKCHVALGKEPLALLALQRSADLGFSQLGLIETDTVFKTLFKSLKFKEILKKISTNQTDDFPRSFSEMKSIGWYQTLYPKNFNSAKRYNLILLLHGNGLTPTAMLQWAKSMDFNETIVVCPAASYTKVKESMTMGQVRLSAAGEELQAPDSLKEEIVRLSADWYANVAKDAMEKLPVKKGTINVIGFSQGGFYASVLASRYPHLFRGVVSICGSMYSEGQIIENLHVISKYGIEFFVCHGIHDPIVPPNTSELFCQALQSHSIPFKYVPFEGEHWATPEVNLEIQKWISNHQDK